MKHLGQYGAYYGVIHEQGTKPYKYNHMQEEKLQQGSPQLNVVFEYVCHKQSYDKEFFRKKFFAKKVIMLGRAEQKFKLEVFEHKCDLAG